ncbi:MAG: hypothetical protein COA96_09105 [SAR86 cluster bacterium]|uniref:Uncharacterized protein n=1 Tax=SAR86 cluster bacterium TaxID=2030880 RepID=A0A2A5B0D2_9GAMM|nr:MAG: hypothetical protein COA96_09105 [SAR86 cluster bacterium]
MSNVVNFSDYRNKLTVDSAKAMRDESTNAMRDGLIPIEFALGINDREQCLDKITQYEVRSIHVRMVNDEPGALLYLIGVSEAIWINKKILQTENISEKEVEQRIDLIQMMENMNFTQMDSLWESFSNKNEG